MPATKAAADVVNKWTRRASVAQEDYRKGVETTPNDWEANAVAANTSYTQAVTAAANGGRFATGVRAAGKARWLQNSLRKGPSRFTEGVTLAQPEYASKIATVLSTIQGVTLGARGPTGSPQNFQRVQPIGEALRRAFGKTGGAGAPR